MTLRCSANQTLLKGREKREEEESLKTLPCMSNAASEAITNNSSRERVRKFDMMMLKGTRDAFEAGTS